jgi:hypothetical protein
LGEATTAPLCKTCRTRHWGTCFTGAPNTFEMVAFGASNPPRYPAEDYARNVARSIAPKPGEVCPCCGERKPVTPAVTKPRNETGDDERGNETSYRRQGGRPKKHADGAARVRAHRQRKNAKGTPA